MKHLLFTYGTLQRGEGNHYVLQGARFVGLAITKPHFTLRAAHPGGGFPYLCPRGLTEVHGEVYEIDDAMLARCDRLEGYPRHYDRIEIELACLAPDGDGELSQSTKALVYIPAEHTLARLDDRMNPVIASGDWKNWIFAEDEEIDAGADDPSDDDQLKPCTACDVEVLVSTKVCPNCGATLGS